MTEILTESFCERCGTRYTFESARPRVRLKGVKVLSRGLKNFVLSDDNSIDEAMAAARSETDRELTAHQLDAFHKTFNFCMSCRQYTCPNCWNEAEARCLSCAPHLGQEVMPAPFPDLAPTSYLIGDTVDTIATNGWTSNGSNGSNGLNGSNGAVHEPLIGDTPAPSVEQPPAAVDVSTFAARLQAMTAPPSTEQPAEAPTKAKSRTEAIAPANVDDLGTAQALVALPLEGDILVDAPLTEDVEPVAAVETPSKIPYVVEAAVVASEGEPAVEPVAAEAEVEVERIAPEAVVAAAAFESAPDEIEVEVEPEPAVTADEIVEPEVAAVAADADQDEEAQIAARLAAFAGAAAVIEVARDDPAQSISEKGVAQTGGLLRRFRAGQSLDAELDAYEREQAAADAVVTPQADAVATDSDLAQAPDETTATVEPETADVAPVATVAEAAAIESEAGAVAEPEPEVVAVEEVAASAAIVAAAAAVPEPEAIEEPAAIIQPEVEAAPEPEAAAHAAEPEVDLLPAAAIVAAADVEAPAREPDVNILHAAAIAAAAAAASQSEVETVQTPAAVEPTPPADDVVPQPTWQIVAPDPTTEVPAAPPAAPAAGIPAAATRADASEPQWPTTPEWPGTAPVAAGLPFLNRPPTPTGGLEALWAESAREVVASPSASGRPAPSAGVQPCVSCGLSLSATARFCRRCGTPQAA